MADSKKSEGFNFAITLLAAFGTILYVAYSYFQTRAIDNRFYVSFVGVINVLLIPSLFLIAYIIVKGYSMEVQDPEKKTLEKIASNIHFVTFWGGTTVFLFIVGTFLWAIAIPNRNIDYFLLNNMFFIGILFLSVAYLYEFKTHLFSWDEIPGNCNNKFIEFLSENFRIDWVKNARIEKLYNDNIIKVSTKYNSLSLSLNSQITKANLKIDNGRTDEFIIKRKHGKLNLYKRQPINALFYFILIVILVAWALLFPLMLNYMNGQVTIDLAGTNYKTGSPIFVSVGVTGRNAESIIYLNHI